jgi:aryl-alcohol dehydrogenase-like predicted oxidoreductase
MSDTKFSSHLKDNTAGRLILGTVQFGMPYGVTNRRGQVSADEVRKILSDARDAGVSFVDTAAGYGTSEASLGECLPDFPEIGVVTKTVVIASPTIGVDEMRKIEEGILHSAEMLRRPHLDGLLVHSGSDLLKAGGKTLAEYLLSVKSDGRVGRVGVSVYDASEIDRILEIFQPDIIQVPLNIFDQRLIRSGHIRALQSAGIEVHARSAFLQGILLAESSSLPTYFQGFDRIFATYSEFLRETRLTPLAACMGFMMQQSGADRVIIGVTTRSELAGIFAALPTGIALPPMDMLASDAKELIDPRVWPKLRDDKEAAKQ